MNVRFMKNIPKTVMSYLYLLKNSYQKMLHHLTIRYKPLNKLQGNIFGWSSIFIILSIKYNRTGLDTFKYRHKMTKFTKYLHVNVMNDRMIGLHLLQGKIKNFIDYCLFCRRISVCLKIIHI